MVNLEGRSKEQICKEFLEVCKKGTLKDCIKFAHEAKRNGVSYVELLIVVVVFVIIYLIYSIYLHTPQRKKKRKK